MRTLYSVILFTFLWNCGVLAQRCPEQFYQHTGLSGGELDAPLFDATGKMLVSHYNSLLHFDGSRFHELQFQDSLGNTEKLYDIFNLKKACDGEIYATLSNKIGSLDFASGMYTPLVDSSYYKLCGYKDVFFIDADSDGNVLLAEYENGVSGIYKYNPKDEKRELLFHMNIWPKYGVIMNKEVPGEKVTVDDIASLLYKANNWMGKLSVKKNRFQMMLNGYAYNTTTDGGFYQYSVNEKRQRYISHLQYKDEVIDLSGKVNLHDLGQDVFGVDVGANLYLCGHQSLREGMDDTLKVFDKVDAACLSSATISNATLDEEGFVWITSNPQGLFKHKMAEANVQSVQANNKTHVNAASNFVRSFIDLDSCSFLVGYNNGGVQLYNRCNETIETVLEESGKKLSGQDFERNHRGEILLLGDAGEISVFDADRKSFRRCKLIAPDTFLFEQPFIFLRQLTDSTYYVGCSGSAYVYSELEPFTFRIKEIKDYRIQLKPFNERIFCAKKLSDGRFVICIEEELRALTFTENVTQPREEVLLRFQDNQVKDLLQWKDSTWYVATTHGLYHYSSDFKQILNIWKDELPDAFLYCVLPDGLGNLWISHNKGIIRFTPSTEEMLFLDESNGLVSAEFNTNAYHRFANNWLVFGSISGFSCFDASVFHVSNYRPNTYLQSVTVNDTKQFFGQPMKSKKWNLLPEENTLTFRLKSTSIAVPRNVRYAYQLVGVDNDWVENEEGLFRYPRLASGKYELRFKSTNKDGIWGKEEVFLFVIQTPFWKTSWFIGFISIAGSILLVLLIRYIAQRQLRMKLRQLKEEKRILEERQRISRDLHDHVGADLAYISGSLEGIEHKKTEEGGIAELRTEVNNAINHLRESIWAMKNKEMDLNEFVLQCRTFAKRQTSIIDGMDVLVTNFVQEEVQLPTQKSLELYRVIQEAVTNACKYSQASLLKVEFRMSQSYLEITIEDNGIGYAEFQNAHGQLSGNGITNMRNRVESLEGKFSMENSSEGGGVMIVVKVNV